MDPPEVHLWTWATLWSIEISAGAPLLERFDARTAGRVEVRVDDLIADQDLELASLRTVLARDVSPSWTTDKPTGRVRRPKKW